VEILTLETIKLLQYETPDFVDPDLWPQNSPETQCISFIVLRLKFIGLPVGEIWPIKSQH